MAVKVKFGINKALVNMARRNGLASIIRDALHAAALYWFRKMLPGHFEENAPRRYPHAYTARATIGTNRRKRKELGHAPPMVWTGTMRQTILSGRPNFHYFKAKASVRLRMYLPYASAMKLWAGRRSSTGRTIDFRRELTAVNAPEQRQLHDLIVRSVTKNIDQALGASGIQWRTHQAG